ncbi:Gfo/Idh/MocA family oxidoreductase [Alphaproteobacteria bacterium]|nr:Gfo/Idh/MocA family oxidoreductase [Alphaproteobacteria bacterium]
MKLCLVGCGRWGKAYLETIKKINSINVDSIVLRKSIPKINESYNFSYNLDTLLDKRDIDGVIIVSPPETHLELAKICIKHRKPVLIEKPFTNSYEQSNFLKEEFYKNQLACMVGYQHLFSEKYKLLKSHISKIGKIKNIHSISINDGPIRKNTTVIRDWGSHEVALAIDLFDDFPKSIKINKIDKFYTNYYRGLYKLSIQFSNQRQFNSLFGNQSSVKKNQIIVEYDNGLVYQDNLSQSGNVIICDNKFFNLENIIQLQCSPLECSIKEFQNTIQKNKLSTNIDLSVNVNKILDQLESKITK